MFGALVGGLVFAWVLVGVSAVLMLFKGPPDAFDVHINDTRQKNNREEPLDRGTIHKNAKGK